MVTSLLLLSYVFGYDMTIYIWLYVSAISAVIMYIAKSLKATTEEYGTEDSSDETKQVLAYLSGVSQLKAASDPQKAAAYVC